MLKDNTRGYYPCLLLSSQNPTKTSTGNFYDLIKNGMCVSQLKPYTFLSASKSETLTVIFKSHITFHRMDVASHTRDRHLTFPSIVFALTENKASANILVHLSSSTEVLLFFWIAFQKDNCCVKGNIC